MRVHVEITDGSDRDGRGEADDGTVPVTGAADATDGGAAPTGGQDGDPDVAAWATAADDTGRPVDAGPPSADLLQALGTEPSTSGGGGGGDALDAGPAPDPDAG